MIPESLLHCHPSCDTEESLERAEVQLNLTLASCCEHSLKSDTVLRKAKDHRLKQPEELLRSLKRMELRKCYLGLDSIVLMEPTGLGLNHHIPI